MAGAARRKERLRPDWPQCVYKYWVDPIGEVPQWVWDTAKQMQALWNEMVEAHDTFRSRRKADEEANGKWDDARKAAEFAALREQLKNLAKSRQGTISNSCYYAVRDSFVTAMNRYWNPDERLRRLRREKKKPDLGLPRKKFRLEKISIPHDYNDAYIGADVLLQPRSKRAVIHLLQVSGPTRGYFSSLGQRIDFQIKLHRPLPAGSFVKEVTFIGEHIQPFGWEWSLGITVEHAPPVRPIECGRVAAIDLGWRLMEDRIRLGVLVDNEGNVIELGLPLNFSKNTQRRAEEYFRHIKPDYEPHICTFDDIRDTMSRQDLRLEECKIALLRQLGLDNSLREYFPAGAAWHKVRDRGLKKLRYKLLEHRPDSPAISVIDHWMSDDLRFQKRYRAAYEHFLKYRDWLYGNIGSAIADYYDVLILEKGLRLDDLAEDDDQPDSVKRSQKFRQWSAPSEFRNYLSRDMLKQGKPIDYREMAYSTASCSICGAVVAVDAPIVLTCANGHAMDQDWNAGANLLADYQQEYNVRAVPGDLTLVRRSQISRAVRRLSSLKSV